MLQGKESYLLDGKKYSAHAGQYLLVNEGRTVDTTNEISAEAVSIFLSKELIGEVYNTFTCNEEELLECEVNQDSAPEFFESAFNHNDGLGDLLKRLHQQVKTEASSGLSKETYYAIAEKLILMQKGVRRGIGNIQNVKKTTREELYRRILTAKNYIEATAEKPFCFEILSKYSGLSKFHLIRVFKSAFGMTPYQYHTSCKVNSAKKLLLKENESIGAIAYLCGFTDVSSFSNIFRKSTGLTPSDFRSTRHTGY